jgi:trehalose utilization protein
MERTIRTIVWSESRQEKTQENVRAVYPDGINGSIAATLRNAGIQARTAILDEPEHGLSEDVLAETDVLLYWAHLAHDEVRDEVVDRIHARVVDGMGLIVFHSAHKSKIFRRLTGTTNQVKWRDADDKERLWVVEPGHPITEGIPEHVDIAQEEMYGEPFDIPTPDLVTFVSWFTGGEVIRSGCCYRRGRGRVFYFRPGHETVPTFHHPDIQRIIVNATRWAAPIPSAAPRFGNVPPLE